MAKSLLSIGIQVFSYDPCQIWKMFQSQKDQGGICCSEIFFNFINESNIDNLIGEKMYKS